MLMYRGMRGELGVVALGKGCCFSLMVVEKRALGLGVPPVMVCSVHCGLPLALQLVGCVWPLAWFTLYDLPSGQGTVTALEP